MKCYVRGNQAHVKNADLRHPSCTVVIYRRKSASPVHSVLPYSSRNMSKEHKIYNYRLSTLRRPVADLFGLLSNKRRILHVSILVMPDTRS